MNKERKAKIEDLITRLDQFIGEVQEVQEAEQDAFDNLPEGIQGSSRGETMEAAAESLDAAECALEEAKEALANSI